MNERINYLFFALGRSVGQDLAVTLTSKSTCSPMLTSGHSFGLGFFILMQFGERGLKLNTRLSLAVLIKRINEDIF